MTTITDEQRLAMLKHLNAGKTLDQVATITGRDRALVLDIVSKHGYPHSLPKGIEVLAAKIEKDRNTLPAGTTITEPRVPRPATTSPSSVTNPDARPIGQPDEIRVLINAGKNHPSKRIQQASARVLDAIGRLRDLITEDAAKNAERREQEAQKAAARAEVARLEKQLAEAKAKLRGKPVAGGVMVEVPAGVSSEQLAQVVEPKKRTVTKKDFDCPDCHTTLHTTEGGYRLHRMKVHPQAVA